MFKEQLETRIIRVNEIIEQYLPEETGTLTAAMNYSVRAGGKRIRPILMQECYALYYGNSKIVEPFMAAIEMIHTFSLVHDDLPALDNDVMRRQMPTTHVKFGEAQAILAGDALLNHAYETVLTSIDIDPRNRRIPHAMRAMAVFTGTKGMIGGESTDIETVGQVLTEEALKSLDLAKTGALIKASMLIGALLAGASEENCRIIAKLGEQIGLAFQIRDDLLDNDGFVPVCGREATEQFLADLTGQALAKIDSLAAKQEEYDPAFLKSLISWLAMREY